MPNESNNITYDFLNVCDDRAYEVAGYDNQKYSKKTIMKYLRIIKNVFNYY